MNRRNYAFLTGVIFLVIAFFHIFQLIFGWKMQIGSVSIPLEASWFVVVLSLALSFLGLGLSKSTKF